MSRSKTAPVFLMVTTTLVLLVLMWVASAAPANTGAKLSGVMVTTDTGQSATTNRGGKYNIGDVPEGDRAVTAAKTGYVTQQQSATVVAGQTTTVDFALVPQ